MGDFPEYAGLTGEEYLEKIVINLTSENEQVREEAGWLLGRGAWDRKFLPDYFRAISLFPDEHHYGSTWRAIHATLLDSDIEYLEQITHHIDGSYALEAAVALSKVPSRMSILPLIEGMKNKVRIDRAIRLIQYPGMVSLSYFHAALEALVEIGDASAIDELQVFTNHESNIISEAVQRAINRINQKNNL